MYKKKVGIYIRETKRFIVDDKYVRNLLNCVESRKDWELVKIYRDMDHGYYPHLPEHMKEMIEDVAEGKCEIILITHLGIFGENRKFKIKEKILQRGGQVVYYHKEKIPKKSKGKSVAENAGYEELANAIIIQACKRTIRVLIGVICVDTEEPIEPILRWQSLRNSSVRIGIRHSHRLTESCL